MSIKRIAREAPLWFLALFLCFNFSRAGIAKFDDASGWARAFLAWGFPVWFRVTIGALEVLAAILILRPRTATYGASLMVAIMLGAVATFAINGRMHPAPLVSLTLAAVVAIFRWRQRLRLEARSSGHPQASGVPA